VLVRYEASCPSEATGAVDIKGLTGKNLANAFMKAETKAKRRVTLSICGLGFLDESEVEDMVPTNNAANEIKKAIEKEAEPVFESDLPEFEITFGKFEGRRLKDIPVSDLANYVEYLETESAKRRKPIEGRALEMLTTVKKFLAETLTMPMGGK